MSYSPWEMLSALATVAAVLVALGVSGHAAWTIRRAEKDRSELAAAKMLSPITALESKAFYLLGWFCLDDEESASQHMQLLLHIQEFEIMARSISIDDLYPLLQLKSHAAKRSARALGLIQTFATDAGAALVHPSWGALRVRTHQYKRWAKMLSEIRDHLTVAVSVCAEAASTGAPRPSPEEIHQP
ncbi:hypothetical protein [Pseudomonas sp. GXZC]|uniref:hypothetical protein n=1 Tax=Pseudomonas sp. GXZC TaxID=3003351 RepID=UPI0022AB0894|nr:hypothetical protein [Pseudomonas sp. GXZC]WAT31783.1 hypothetical protein OZ428_16000 [Pseudomonas sp. GXZC]